MTRFKIVMNQASGAGAQQRQAALHEAVAAASMSMQIVEAGPGKLIETIKSAAQNADILVAAGGDGTVSAVAAVAIEHSLTFGVIPFGTLNHFAGDAGLPTDFAEAIAVIGAGHTTKIDYATIAGTVFLNNVSIGVYPTLVRRREKQEKRLGKWPAAFIEAWGIIRRPIRRQALSITGPAGRTRLRSAFVFIGNNDYHLEDAGFSNRTSLSGGNLSLFAFRSRGRLGIIMSAVRTVLGRTDHPEILSLSGPSFTIASEQSKLEIAHDGEVDQFTNPVEITLQPGGLRLLVPKP